MAGADGAELRLGRGRASRSPIAVVRGFARQEVRTIGNFWVDLTRATFYVLLPISFIGALFLCSQGVIQNLNPYTTVTTVEGAKQTIAQGPVASQEAIKNWAPTAADSSTPTPRIRSRIPRRSPTCSRCG